MPMLFAGDDRVIPDCISFASIPHTSKIFTDFLSYSSDARRFFPTQPDAAHIAAFAKSVPRDPQRQAAVADILDKQNRSWGASEATLRNIRTASQRRVCRRHRTAGGTVWRTGAGAV